MSSPQRRPATSQMTREALLQAARDELVEGGHASVGLRAVARRAGLSHAAPAHFFTDRAGLLTAVATEGFRQLAERLEVEAGTTDARDRLAALGRVYVDFGLENPALVDLMFRRSELRADDAELVDAQRASISRLIAAVTDTDTAHTSAGGADAGSRGALAPDDHRLALVSWALVHGLVVLAREGALAGPAERADDDSAAAARDLVDFYATRLLSDQS